MKLVIKPDINSFEHILETEIYKKLWKQNSRKILKAFRNVTGLDFQQRVITARIGNIEQSISGSFHYPMRLRMLVAKPNDKLVLLIHELSHRLLGGNALGVVNLGIVSRKDNNSDEANEYDHRHIYLFEYDVIKLALGEDMGNACLKFEGKVSGTENINDNSHQKAWNWAMKMSFEERQIAVKRLSSKAITRDKWSDTDINIILTTPANWYEFLTAR